MGGDWRMQKWEWRNAKVYWFTIHTSRGIYIKGRININSKGLGDIVIIRPNDSQRNIIIVWQYTHEWQSQD